MTEMNEETGPQWAGTPHGADDRQPARSPENAECADVVIDAELVDPIGIDDARRLDKRIRLLVGTINENIAELHALVEEAKGGHAHVALGYPSWTAYLADVFTVHVRLDRDQRRELVGYLSGEGMSQRVIADVVGASQDTVRRDLTGERNRSPGPQASAATGGGNSSREAEPEIPYQEMADVGDAEFEQVLAEARAEGDLSRENVSRLCRDRSTQQKTTVGRDGKTYRRTTACPDCGDKRPTWLGSSHKCSRRRSKATVSPAEKQRKLIMRIGAKLVDPMADSNSLLRGALLEDIAPEEARRYADALASQLRPIVNVFELLLERAGELTSEAAADQ